MPSDNQPIAIHWFRRDLRLDDNTGLNAALDSGLPVLGLFIFDADILESLPKDDARVTFIHESLQQLNTALAEFGSSLLVKCGKPEDVWRQILGELNVTAVYTNEDYEPYAIDRDSSIGSILAESDIAFNVYCDHVLYKPGTVLKDDGDPYTVYTPFRNKLMAYSRTHGFPGIGTRPNDNFVAGNYALPRLSDFGFEESSIKVPPLHAEYIAGYDRDRDDPVLQHTTLAGPHLRFGTISIRQLAKQGKEENDTYLGELIWREFFMNILCHFPRVVANNFKSQYDSIPWRNNQEEFSKWCSGETGFPMVDAGMRQLNSTGYMHNRVRMVVASFLCKHLLIDWKWGEAYFAEKLLDYELASNNGNWQWAAGTGCDAAPYFRVFNPGTQLKKYDPKGVYARRWIDEYGTPAYPSPMVDHSFARKRAIETYKSALA